VLTLKEIVSEGDELRLFRELLQEYQSFLGVDLCFQKFESELADPFSKYSPPAGVVLLGYWDGEVCASGALQNLGDGICELKRIYVRPAFRRRGIARAISEYLMSRAGEIGYTTARLDTLRRLAGAVDLYASLGFQEIEPYNFNPEADIVYMERPLPIEKGRQTSEGAQTSNEAQTSEGARTSTSAP
jgi:putative acetyltransferase